MNDNWIAFFTILAGVANLLCARDLLKSKSVNSMTFLSVSIVGGLCGIYYFTGSSFETVPWGWTFSTSWPLYLAVFAAVVELIGLNGRNHEKEQRKSLSRKMLTFGSLTFFACIIYVTLGYIWALIVGFIPSLLGLEFPEWAAATQALAVLFIVSLVAFVIGLVKSLKGKHNAGLLFMGIAYFVLAVLMFSLFMGSPFGQII